MTNIEPVIIYCVSVCPGSSDPLYIVTYYIKWVTTSWTYCNPGMRVHFGVAAGEGLATGSRKSCGSSPTGPGIPNLNVVVVYGVLISLEF